MIYTVLKLVPKAFGSYKNGTPCGLHWIRKPGNAILICHVDAAGEVADCDGAVYLYPSLELAIVADFRNKLLLNFSFESVI